MSRAEELKILQAINAMLGGESAEGHLATKAFAAGRIKPQEFGLLTEEARQRFRDEGHEISPAAPSLLQQGESQQGPRVITRQEFDAIDPMKRHEFLKDGGRVEG